MDAMEQATSPQLVFPPQVAFSWTLRSARAQRSRSKTRPPGIPYRILGTAADDRELAAVRAFCEEHRLNLELAQA